MHYEFLGKHSQRADSLYSIAVTQNQYTNGSVVTAAPYTSEDNQQWIFDDAFDRENVTIESAKVAVFAH